MSEATASERAGIVSSLWQQGQRLETALRFAAGREVPADQVAAALGVSRATLRALATSYDVEAYR